MRLQRSELTANQLVRFVPVEIFDAVDVLTEFREHSILHLPSLQGRSIGHAMKRHH